MGEQQGLTRELTGRIARAYSAHAAVLARTLKPFADMTARPGAERAALRRVREIVRRLDVQATAWARVAAARAFAAKTKEVGRVARNIGRLENAGEKGHAAAVERNAAGMARKFLEANATILTTAASFLAAYGKAVAGVDSARAREAQFMAPDMAGEMARKVEWYLERGYSEQAISRRLRQYLGKMAGGKDLIEVGGRFYAIKEFAEMTARTALHECYVDATVEECKRWDNDLVQFSRHDSPCDACAQLEGMVFSISGEDDEFPALDEPLELEVNGKPVTVDPRLPHPNCEHNLNPVSRRILEATGEL